MSPKMSVYKAAILLTGGLITDDMMTEKSHVGGSRTF